MKSVHCHTAHPLCSVLRPRLERPLGTGRIAWSAPAAGGETHGVLADFVGGGRAP